MEAWLDLKERGDNGEQVGSKNILKHKRDVFRLSQIILEADKVKLPNDIRIDMEKFISNIANEYDIGILGTKTEILDLLKKVYL